MAIAVANRYARALAEVVGPEGDYRGVLDALRTFSATYSESADLRMALDSPAIPVDKKIVLAETIATRLGLPTVAASFVRVLVTNYRIEFIGEICAAFERIANDRMGIVAVKVRSATPLSAGEQETLRTRFAEVTRKTVLMDFQLDAALLGGIQAQIHSTIYDGSVRGHLDRIREQLMKR